MQAKSPTVLVILDGWGVAPPSNGNAITLAKTPFYDKLLDDYPSAVLGATGKNVGLEDNKMSGSEAGHMNIGAGRIVHQDSYYISESIKDGSFFINPALMGAIHHAQKERTKLHLMGLMGDSDSPHSDPEHFRAVLKLAKKNKVEEVFCHLFTDGRDSYPRSARVHLKHFRKIMAEEGIGKIATLSGRFYAMDRAKNWERLVMAYDAIVNCKGTFAESAEKAIDESYKRGLSDEYIYPTVIIEDNKPVARMEKGDGVIFFNLRSDRARQFTKLFVAKYKDGIMPDDMPVLQKINNLYFAAMTDFGPDLQVHTAFPGKTIRATIPMVLGNIRQLYTAESEKYAHVTYFLNGGYADPVDKEDRIMIASQITDNFAKIPEMSAGILNQNIINNIKHDIYDFVTVNFANADIVGHTGDLKAVVKAVEYLDKQMEELAKVVLEKKGQLLITADHGNADDMIDAGTSQPNTFHSKNPVPLIVVSEKLKDKRLQDGGVLGNIAPTLLEMMEIEKPKAMKCDSLLV